MTSVCYYRAGKDKKGFYEPCKDVIQHDKKRALFIERLKNDETFRTKTLRWTHRSVEEYIEEYNKRGACPGICVKNAEVMMCSTLYKKGTLISRAGTESKVTTAEGVEKVFDSKLICPYDPSHDADEIPEDVCKVKAFGEAALLLVMQRRFVEKLSIYTYVGDIILCLNPYMYLPQMVDIAEYPNQKIYKLGEDPSSYASAYFAYHGLFDATSNLRNQSCVVSGESGAGKTVACGFIMKYLAKLSNWRKMELNDTDADGEDADITSLVAGVSPFLEAFGNAKTNMNDNSSRFGKFTKIWFSNGKIIGAELEHYLLEKERLCSQGSGERNYHIFYLLLRGGKEKNYTEVNDFKLRSCDSYPKLCEGGSSVIGHGHGPEYDIKRFNAPLSDDPDDTGVRAALRAANVDDEKQNALWQTIAGCLKLLSVEFSSVGDEGSKVSDPEFAKEVAELLGLSENFGEMLCIYRLNLPGGKFADKACNAAGSEDNRNALAKDIYNRIFQWLIMTVCNDVLSPKGDKDAFVGLLDIFGFEIMPKNSIEQLCINFANERLQQLFNKHVFEDEKTTYVKEGIPTEMIPVHKDNTPCCNLIMKKSKKFIGMFPMLDDMQANATDLQFVALSCQKFGKAKGVNTKAKDTITKSASEYFYGDKKHDYAFNIVHFAGVVRYDARKFLAKNKDKLPPQLNELASESSHTFLSNLYDNSKMKGKRFKTLASKYISQLKSLANTLEETTPHYVRCVKPNDIHYRPVDGIASFNHWKTYRQLLYAGVMEVVKIKKQGYSFCRPYSELWENVCVKYKYYNFLSVDASVDPREGCEVLAKVALKGPILVKDLATGEERTNYFWTLGKTCFFGKDDTLDQLREWHKVKLLSILHPFLRYMSCKTSLCQAMQAQMQLVYLWQNKLRQRKLAKIIVPTITLQKMLRAVKDRQVYVRRRALEHAKNCIRSDWRSFHYRGKFCLVSYELSRIELVRAASIMIQKNWKNYDNYLKWYGAYKAIVHYRGRVLIDKFTVKEIEFVKTKLASTLLGRKMMFTLNAHRLRLRSQVHILAYLAKQLFKKRLKRLALERLASYTVEGNWLCDIERFAFIRRIQAVIVIQANLRGYLKYTYYQAELKRWKKGQSFTKMVVLRNRFKTKCRETEKVQKWFRTLLLLRHFRLEKRRRFMIEYACSTYFFRKRLREWVNEMSMAASEGDLEKCNELMHVQNHRFWHWIEHLVKERVLYKGKSFVTHPLINMRDRVLWNSPLHSAAKSGNIEVVKFLLEKGCNAEVVNVEKDTPLHISALQGDDAFQITKELYFACLTMSKVHEGISWILTFEAVNLYGQTVLDNALAIEDSANTVLWLMDKDALASADLVEQMEKRELEKMEARQELQARTMLLKSLEEQERHEDPYYTYLMLDSKTIDPLSKKIKKQNDRREHIIQLRMKMKHAKYAAICLQRVFRGWRVRLNYPIFFRGGEERYKRLVAAEKHLRDKISKKRMKERKRRKLLGEKRKRTARQLRGVDPLSSRRSTLDYDSAQLQGKLMNQLEIESEKRCAEMEVRLANKARERQDRVKRRQLNAALEAKKRKEEAEANGSVGKDHVYSNEPVNQRLKRLLLKQDIPASQSLSISSFPLVEVKKNRNSDNKSYKREAKALPNPSTNISSGEANSMDKQMGSPPGASRNAKNKTFWQLQEEGENLVSGEVNIELPIQRRLVKTKEFLVSELEEKKKEYANNFITEQTNMVRSENEKLKDEIRKIEAEINVLTHSKDSSVAVSMTQRPKLAKSCLIKAWLAMTHFSTHPRLRGWHYQDDNGEIFGPYTSVTMRGWLTGGFLKFSLLVRYGDDGPFAKLSELFPNSSVAFLIEPVAFLERAQRELISRKHEK
eukprot:g2033.t1